VTRSNSFPRCSVTSANCKTLLLKRKARLPQCGITSPQCKARP